MYIPCVSHSHNVAITGEILHAMNKYSDFPKMVIFRMLTYSVLELSTVVIQITYISFLTVTYILVQHDDKVLYLPVYKSKLCIS